MLRLLVITGLLKFKLLVRNSSTSAQGIQMQSDEEGTIG